MTPDLYFFDASSERRDLFVSQSMVSSLPVPNAGPALLKSTWSKMDIQENEMIIESSALVFEYSNSFEFDKTKNTNTHKTRIYSRDSLKFCRKVTKLIEQQILLRSDLFQKMIGFNTTILQTFLHTLGIQQQIDPSDLNTLQIDCILSVWKKFSDVLSYRKNNKICLVKEEHWNLVFEKKTFTEITNSALSELLMTRRGKNLQILLNDTTFCEILSRMLYSTNKILTIISVLRDNSAKGEYIRGLATADNFILLVMMPELFKYYNHRGGKFALECCGKCKVCCSRAIPNDFGISLQQARQRKKEIINSINEMFLTYDEGNPNFIFSLMKFAFEEF